MRERIKKIIIAGLIILLVAGGIIFLPQIFGEAVYPLKYEGLVRKYSAQYGLEPALVAAIIYKESGFNPNAGSPAGAAGLMQLMPATAAGIARRMGVGSYNIRDPETNIMFGTNYFAGQMGRYNGNLEAALVGYNGGGGAGDRFIAGGAIPGESDNYRRTVPKIWEAYRALYGPNLDLNVEGGPPPSEGAPTPAPSPAAPATTVAQVQPTATIAQTTFFKPPNSLGLWQKVLSGKIFELING